MQGPNPLDWLRNISILFSTAEADSPARFTQFTYFTILNIRIVFKGVYNKDQIFYFTKV